MVACCFYTFVNGPYDLPLRRGARAASVAAGSRRNVRPRWQPFRRRAIDQPHAKWLVVADGRFHVCFVGRLGGLILRTFAHLNSVDPGFRGEQVLTLRTALPTTKYRGVAARGVFYSQVLERIRALPGVVDAGYTSWLPYRNYGGTSGFVIEGRAPLPPGQQNDANIRLVTPGYFTAMGMTLLEGRLLTTADHEGTEPVVVINRTMSRQFWPAESPINRRMRVCRECPSFRLSVSSAIFIKRRSTPKSGQNTSCLLIRYLN